MATRFVNIDRDTPPLLPPDLRDWVPENHLVHFILDTVETLDLQGMRVNERGGWTGSGFGVRGRALTAASGNRG